MKLNRNELHHMINQIDEDLLQEAAEERDAGNVQTWRRVVPVAVCVVALITAASISILTRGIRIENGKEHHGTSILTEEELSETTVVTDDKYTISEEQKDYASVLNMITELLAKKSDSAEMLVQSVELYILPDTLEISYGSVCLTQSEQEKTYTVTIYPDTIEIHETQTTEDTKNSLSAMNWALFTEVLENSENVFAQFTESTYAIVSEIMENPVSEDENCVLLFYHEGELSEISETDSSGTESYAYGIQIQSQRMVPDDDEFYNYQLMIFVD